MSRAYVPIVAAIAIVIAGALWYTRSPEGDANMMDEPGAGKFAYTCDSGVEFLLSPARDLSSVSIEPVEGMPYPEASGLAEGPTDTGRRYQNQLYEMHGKGETLTLYDKTSEKFYTCEPQPRPDEPPLNFGD